MEKDYMDRKAKFKREKSSAVLDNKWQQNKGVWKF